MTKIKIPNTTLICVDCIHPDQSKLAIEKTLSICEFDSVKLFTDRTFNGSSFDTISIPKISSLKEYSKFMVLDLSEKISTEFAMVIQADGYPINKDAWTDLYLKYDYIGAPWVRHLFYDIPGYPKVNENNMVGNGGFSIRSKNLLDKAKKITEVIGIDKIGSYEDCYLARSIKGLLEQNSIKFAPVGLALGFSFENLVYSGQFGFHGKKTIEINRNIIS